MNFKASIFTIVSALSCMSLYSNDGQAATCHGPGWYVYDSNPDWCMPCPAGCYCPNDAEKMKYSKVQWQKCTSGLESWGIYTCAPGYTSDSTTQLCTGLGKNTYCKGPQLATECYFKAKDTGNRVYAGKTATKCNAGTYIKAGYEKCQPCPSGKICPGKRAQTKTTTMMGTNYIDVPAHKTWSTSWHFTSTDLFKSPSEDSGIYSCPSGQSANSSHTACVKGNGSSGKSTIKCDAGKYLPANSTVCTACRIDGRYYCPGGELVPSSSDVGMAVCPSWKVVSANRTACISSSSNTNSSSQSGSVAKCNPGQYLPANTKQCVSCSHLDSRYYCPGGKISFAAVDLGIVECPGGKIADKLHTSCIVQNKPTVRCEPGQYLPATASVCTACPGDSRYYCPGGKTYNIENFEQGKLTCEYGKEANAAKTACVTVSAIEVPAGQYLPADKVTPVKCKGSNNYCPGGQFDMESFDQGIFECPLSSRPNSAKTACTITLSKVQMQFGASGTGTPYPRQCWHQTDDPAQYMSCVLANSVTGK